MKNSRRFGSDRQICQGKWKVALCAGGPPGRVVLDDDLVVIVRRNDAGARHGPAYREASLGCLVRPFPSRTTVGSGAEEERQPCKDKGPDDHAVSREGHKTCSLKQEVTLSS